MDSPIAKRRYMTRIVVILIKYASRQSAYMSKQETTLYIKCYDQYFVHRKA